MHSKTINLGVYCSAPHGLHSDRIRMAFGREEPQELDSQQRFQCNAKSHNGCSTCACSAHLQSCAADCKRETEVSCPLLRN